MRHAALASLFGLAAAGTLTGCPDRTISPVDPLQGRVEAKDIPVKVNRNVDILFLIDDSPSMGDKQKNLATNFPRFIDVLRSIQGGLPSIHIGVATSDLGAKGADGVIAPGIGDLSRGGCAGSGKAGNLQLFGAPVSGGPFISDILNEMTGVRTQNYTGTLEGTFAQMAKAGAGGCGFEQHLEGMKQALSLAAMPSTPNSGFLRDDAFLAVIIIADEDDCSMQHTTMLASATSPTLGTLASFRCTRFGIICDDNGATSDAMNATGVKGRCHPADNSPYLTNVSDYAKFLKGLKPTDPSKVIVAGIVGPPTPVVTELRALDSKSSPIPALAHSCTYTGSTGTEVADPAVRIKFFLDQFPNRSTFVPICQADLSAGLQQIGDLLKNVIGDPCIEGQLKGPPYECSVSTITNPNSTTPTKALLDACTATSTTPCWHLVADPVNCPTDPKTGQRPQNLTLKIENKDQLQLDTHVIANCVTEVTNN
jgi:hypothetical protein